MRRRQSPSAVLLLAFVANLLLLLISQRQPIALLLTFLPHRLFDESSSYLQQSLIVNNNQRRQLRHYDQQRASKQQHALPSFTMRIKIMNTYSYSDDSTFVQNFQKELETLVEEHVTSVVHEELPGIPMVFYARLSKTKHTEEHAIVEANFTGYAQFQNEEGTPPYSSQSLMMALLKRALVTKEGYTQLVHQLHLSSQLPMIRGVKISLSPILPATNTERAAPPGKVIVRSSSSTALLIQNGQDASRIITLLSALALLSLSLLFIHYMIRPRKKNWKVTKNPSRWWASLFRGSTTSNTEPKSRQRTRSLDRKREINNSPSTKKWQSASSLSHSSYHSRSAPYSSGATAKNALVGHAVHHRQAVAPRTSSMVHTLDDTASPRRARRPVEPKSTTSLGVSLGGSG